MSERPNTFVDMDGKAYAVGQTVLVASLGATSRSPHITRKKVTGFSTGGFPMLEVTEWSGKGPQSVPLRMPHRHLIQEDNSEELALLSALEDAGVDNWEGYSIAYRAAHGADDD